MAVVESGQTEVQRVLARGPIADPLPTLEEGAEVAGRKRPVRDKAAVPPPDEG